MYNGIGLPTPRGSGTNGYVQRNLASIRKRGNPVPHSDRTQVREKSFELVTHEKKRQIEAKCLKLRISMEKDGYRESKIEREVDRYRRRKLEELAQMSEQEHGDRLKRSFGISRDYVDGSAVTQMKRDEKHEVKKEELKVKKEEPKIKTEKVKEEVKKEG